jgi:hypothetical protein
MPIKLQEEQVGQTFLSAECASSLPADRNVCPTLAKNAC